MEMCQQCRYTVSATVAEWSATKRLFYLTLKKDQHTKNREGQCEKAFIGCPSQIRWRFLHCPVSKMDDVHKLTWPPTLPFLP